MIQVASQTLGPTDEGYAEWRDLVRPVCLLMIRDGFAGLVVTAISDDCTETQIVWSMNEKPVPQPSREWVDAMFPVLECIEALRIQTLRLTNNGSNNINLKVTPRIG